MACKQIFCIFLFIAGSTLFGTLLSQVHYSSVQAILLPCSKRICINLKNSLSFLKSLLAKIPSLKYWFQAKL
jgi:hypothetical protein